ncbi:hypothetical protein D3C81_1190930 [compost metagenome]
MVIDKELSILHCNLISRQSDAPFDIIFTFVYWSGLNGKLRINGLPAVGSDQVIVTCILVFQGYCITCGEIKDNDIISLYLLKARQSFVRQLNQLRVSLSSCYWHRMMRKRKSNWRIRHTRAIIQFTHK